MFHKWIFAGENVGPGVAWCPECGALGEFPNTEGGPIENIMLPHRADNPCKENEGETYVSS